jgi:predicted MFS family arabinose efflux permease
MSRFDCRFRDSLFRLLHLIVVRVSAVSSFSAKNNVKSTIIWGRTVMPERAPARSIYILVLLFLINLMNFFDRTIPAVVLEPIRKEFSLDDTALGILGASFTLIYAVAGVPLGYLADRFRRTHILAAGLTAWSLLTAASGLAWSFMSFFWIRLLVGVGEASCAPAANSLIGDLFPSEKRARALGIFMLGLPLGLLLAFSIVGALAQNYGWRVPFYLAAVPGFVVAAMIMFAAEPVRGSQETYAIDATAALDRPMRRILAIPTVWWIIASGATINFAAYAMGTFLPTMLIRYHGLSIGKAGLIAALVLGATGLVGLTAGGWLADYLHKKFLRGRLLLASCSMLVATPLLYFGLAQPVGAADAATILLSLGWLLYFSYYCSVYSALQDVVEPRLRATAMAVYFFFQYVLGAGFGTVVTGALSDMYARQAMTAAGTSEMTDAFRAIGLQSAMTLVVPLAIALTCVSLFFAARSFIADARKTASVGQRIGGLATAS